MSLRSIKFYYKKIMHLKYIQGSISTTVITLTLGQRWNCVCVCMVCACLCVCSWVSEDCSKNRVCLFYSCSWSYICISVSCICIFIRYILSFWNRILCSSRIDLKKYQNSSCSDMFSECLVSCSLQWCFILSVVRVTNMGST